MGQGMGQGQGSMMSGPGGGSARGGRSTENMPVKDGGMNMQEAPRDNDNRPDELRGEDVDKSSLRGGRRRDAAWFTTLPQGVRKAMQSRAKRALPRGYEERLKKYFESLD